MVAATSPPSQQAVLNFTNLVSESRRVIKSQLFNFLALSFLFLLPLCVASAVSSTLQNLFSHTAISHNNFLLNQTANSTSFAPVRDIEQQNQQASFLPAYELLVALAYFLFYLVLSVCAVGSITYTAFHAFHRQPIKPKSIIMSLSTSFFPLLATTLLANAIVFAITIIFALFFTSMIVASCLLGFQNQAFSPYFTVIFVAMVILYLLAFTYLQVNWALASVVVVAESTWGFEALKRSKTLVKGRRGIALILCLIFMFWYAVLERSTKYPTTLETDEPKCLFLLLLVVKIAVTSSFKSLLLLFEMVLNTVMYVSCNAIHDGGENIGGEYVILAVDDHQKVGHDRVVCVDHVSKLDAYNEV